MATLTGCFYKPDSKDSPQRSRSHKPRLCLLCYPFPTLKASVFIQPAALKKFLLSIVNPG